MKAIVRNIDKAYLPHNVDAEGKNRLHIVTEVDFVDDAGTVVESQNYAHLPENFDGAYFQRQADIMQRSADELVERGKEVAARQTLEGPADEKIRKFKLEFGDVVKLRDEVKS
jgi:hypothetical protein